VPLGIPHVSKEIWYVSVFLDIPHVSKEIWYVSVPLGIPHVSKEIWYVSVPLGIPHVSNEEVLLCGYSIPKDMVVICNHLAVHSNSTYWESPLQFDPDRFLHFDTAGGRPRLVDKNYFIPFSIGLYV